MSNLVEMHLHRVAWLCRPMPAFGTTRRLVGEQAHALEFVTWQFVGHCLQGSRVVRCGDPIGPIRSAIQVRTKVHRCKRTVAFHAGLDPHFDRMAPPVN